MTANWDVNCLSFAAMLSPFLSDTCVHLLGGYIQFPSVCQETARVPNQDCNHSAVRVEMLSKVVCNEHFSVGLQ